MLRKFTWHCMMFYDIALYCMVLNWIDTVVLILGDWYDTGGVKIWLNLSMKLCEFGIWKCTFVQMFLDKLEFRSDHLLFRSFDPKLLPATLCFSFSAVFLSNIYEEVKAGNNKINIAMDWLEFQGGLFCSKFVLKRLWQIRPKFAFCSVIEHEKFS